MLEIDFNSGGHIQISGRFDASQTERATNVFGSVNESSTVDMAELEYISSAGLGILLETQQRLISGGGTGLKLINLNKHVLEVFRIAGFHQVFEIES